MNITVKIGQLPLVCSVLSLGLLLPLVRSLAGTSQLITVGVGTISLIPWWWYYFWQGLSFCVNRKSAFRIDRISPVCCCLHWGLVASFIALLSHQPMAGLKRKRHSR